MQTPAVVPDSMPILALSHCALFSEEYIEQVDRLLSSNVRKSPANIETEAAPPVKAKKK